MNDPIRVGTSGWSYDDWVGPFYPQGTAKRDYLAAYAEQFDVVEVDSTFYRPPSVRMVDGWAAHTPPGFRFALKAPREITHERVLVDCEPAMEGLLTALKPLGEKTLGLLLQFGYFNRSAFGSAGPFFARLDGFLKEFAPRVPMAVEIRNKNWLTADYFELLRAHHVAAALVEQSWLPPIDQLIEQHDVVTGPFAYVRLIGDREAVEKTTQTWEKTVVDRSADLRRIARALRQVAERTKVVVFANNHYAGHGPATCR
jgi:uncharacterized protein YecE (DUF72 family)